jgi:hypothetical protein
VDGVAVVFEEAATYPAALVGLYITLSFPTSNNVSPASRRNRVSGGATIGPWRCGDAGDLPLSCWAAGGIFPYTFPNMAMHIMAYSSYSSTKHEAPRSSGLVGHATIVQ